MNVLGVILILLFGAGLGAWATIDVYRYRRTDGEAALLAEVDAMRAPHHLSLAAYRARQFMSDQHADMPFAQRQVIDVDVVEER